MTLSPLRSTDPKPISLAAKGRESTLVGIALNLTLAAGKITAGMLGHSFALIADGVESLSDILSSLVVFFGLRLAVKPRDENHPYGHGKAEPLAALTVGLALGAAAVTIAIQSVREIRTPHDSPAPFTLIVLAGVLIVKESLFRYVMHVGRAIDSTAVKADAWHHRSDAITSALAFVGITIALVGGPGWESADSWAALVASFVILHNAYSQLRPALAELSDVAPPKTVEQQIRAVAAMVPGVQGLDKCFVRKMGFEFYVDLHILVDGNMAVNAGHLIAHAVEDSIQAAYPRVADVLVHVEPTPQTRL
jgi:cation diffusion facilitator family transporter